MLKIRHSREGGNPCQQPSHMYGVTEPGTPSETFSNNESTDNALAWIPACAGMTLKFLWEMIRKCMEKQPCVYILGSQKNGTLYTGVTSNLIKRTYEHKNSLAEGFTKEHSIKRLIWFELHETMETAITREKRIKKWNRQWKINLIEQENPDWNDLWPQITQ